MCGVANQRGSLCGRIGACPFHKTNTSDEPPINVGKEGNEGDGLKDTRENVKETKAETQIENAPDQAGKGNQSTEQNEKAKDSNGANEEIETKKRPREEGTAAAPPPTGTAPIVTPPKKKRFKVSWSVEEHRLFLQALRQYGKGKWKQIAEVVKTRNANQCQSHAQKYFARQSLDPSQRKKSSIHDFTDDSFAEIRAKEAALNAGIFKGGIGSKGGGGGSVGDVAKLVESAKAAVASVTKPNGVGSAVGSGGMTTVPIFSMAGIHGGFNMSSYGPVLPGMFNPSTTYDPNAPPSLQKVRVTVHMNGELKNGKALILPNTFEKFFELATEKLKAEKRLTRVFTRMGGEISSLDEMCPDDVLLLSSGDDFIYPPSPLE